MDLVTRMRLYAEDLHCINPTSEAVKCLSLGADAIDKLQYRVVELEREVAQWKNNHATVVAQARILKERDDMPIERDDFSGGLAELAVSRLTTQDARIAELEQRGERK